MTKAAILTTAAILAPAGLAGQNRLASNLVTHSEVTINKPASAIWPKIVDPSEWKMGLKLWHHTGPAGLGEILAAGDPADKANVAFFIENVEFVPNQRRTIKLYTPAGQLIGYATWTLKEAGGKTMASYDVFSETLLTTEQAKATTAEQVRAAEQTALATNQKRFDDELLALKRLVEGKK